MTAVLLFLFALNLYAMDFFIKEVEITHGKKEMRYFLRFMAGIFIFCSLGVALNL